MSTSDAIPLASLIRPRSEDDLLEEERETKRAKLEGGEDGQQFDRAPEAGQPTAVEETMDYSSADAKYNLENLLPQSRSLMGLPPAPELPPDGFMHRTCEVDVGISQYIGNNLSEINGIIKQRYVPSSPLQGLQVATSMLTCC
jgi:tRNA pseudouridine13 synthase